jgi:hypothetical protein
MVYAKFFLTKKVKRQNKAIATKISAQVQYDYKHKNLPKN